MSLVDRQYKSTWPGPHQALAQTAALKSPVRLAPGESAAAQNVGREHLRRPQYDGVRGPGWPKRKKGQTNPSKSCRINTMIQKTNLEQTRQVL